MASVPHLIGLTAPLFLLVLIGYSLIRWVHWPTAVGDALTRFVFTIALPILLFRMMSQFARQPTVDPGVLAAFFGSCVAVFVLGRLVAAFVFRLDGVGQSIFGVGGIFSNNVLLGIPLAQVTLGEAAVPVVSLVIVFNAFLLWTLVTVSVEWARHRAPSPAALLRTARDVVGNPIVAAILGGAAFGWSGLPVPRVADRTMELVSQAAAPLSLVALGMGLAAFGFVGSMRIASGISAMKLFVQPLIVFGLARALHLPALETQAVVMVASLPVGANVYLMAKEFGALGGPVAVSLVLSTLLSAVTTPAFIAFASPG